MYLMYFKMSKMWLNYNLPKHKNPSYYYISWSKSVYRIICLHLVVYNIYPIFVKLKILMETQCEDLVMLKIRCIVMRKMF